jgi:SAM-dependent methyltransferase
MNERLRELRRLLRRVRTRLRRLDGVYQSDKPISKIIAISTVKNEQDIIEPFLRHNRPFVDAILVMDHMSSDETRRIATECARELGGILIADLPVFAHDHALFMTNALYRMQTAYFSEFVVFLDADEFINCKDRAEFESIIESIPSGQCGEAAWVTFLPEPDAVKAVDPLRAMNCRRKLERPPEAKSVVRLDGQHDPFLKVGRGNHFLWSVDGEKVPRISVKGLSFKHFPVRSIEQMKLKGIVGWLANLARDPKAEHDGSAWQKRRLFDIFTGRNTVFGESLLFEEALTYAQNSSWNDFLGNYMKEDHGIDLTRKYSSGAVGDPVLLMASAWKSSIEAQKSSSGLAGELVYDRLKKVSMERNRKLRNLGSGLDVTPLQFFSDLIKPSSVLDLGCGDGSALCLLQSRCEAIVLGVDVVALEQTLLDEREFIKADLREPLRIKKNFDTVLCLNLGEFLEPEHQEVLFDTIVAHADSFILFSMAQPDQPAGRLAARRSIPSVLEAFACRGWQADLALTLQLRALSSTMRFSRSLLALRPRMNAQSDNAELARMAQYPFRWVREARGVREASMLEPLPKASAGYGARLISSKGRRQRH